MGSDWLILNISPDRERDSKRLVELVNNEPQRYHFLSPSKLRIKFGIHSPAEDLSKIEKVIEELNLS